MSRFGGRGAVVSRKSSGAGTPSEIVVGIIKDIKVVNPRQDTFYKNGEGDHAVIALAQDAFGIKAEFDEEKEEFTTLVKVTVKEPPPPPAPVPGEKPKNGPRTIHGWTKRAGSGQPLKVGDAVFLRGCYKNGDVISAERSNAGPTKENMAGDENGENAKQILLPGAAICVPEAVTKKDPKGDQTWQNVWMLESEGASVLADSVKEGVSVEPALRLAIENLLKTPSPVAHAFAVIARKTGPEDQMQAIAADANSRLGSLGVARPQKVGDEYIPATSDKVYENFINSAKDLRPIIEGKTPGYQLVFVPGICARQSESLVPGGKFNDNNRDNSKRYEVYDVEDDGTPFVYDRGFAIGTMVLTRVADEISAPYYSTDQYNNKAQALVYAIGDLPTLHTHPAHEAGARMMAEENIKLKNKFYESRNGKKDGKKPSGKPDPADDVPF